MTLCPICDAERPPVDGAPLEGDLAVCEACGSILVWEGLGWRVATGEEWEDMPPYLRRTIERARRRR